MPVAEAGKCIRGPDVAPTGILWSINNPLVKKLDRWVPFG